MGKERIQHDKRKGDGGLRGLKERNHSYGHGGCRGEIGLSPRKSEPPQRRSG